MVTSDYLVLKFSNGTKDLKREGGRLKTIRILVGLAHQKQMPTLEKSVKLLKKSLPEHSSIC
jgi:hypothetical protein